MGGLANYLTIESLGSVNRGGLCISFFPLFLIFPFHLVALMILKFLGHLLRVPTFGILIRKNFFL